MSDSQQTVGPPSPEEPSRSEDPQQVNNYTQSQSPTSSEPNSNEASTVAAPHPQNASSGASAAAVSAPSAQYPSGGRLLAVGILAPFVLMIGGVLLAVLALGTGASHSTIVNLMIPALVEVAAVCLFHKILWGTFKPNLGNFRVKPISRKQMLQGMGLGLFSLVLLQVSAYLISLVFHDHVGSSETSKSLAEGNRGSVFLVLLLLVPLAIPFLEELFFRGVVFGSLLELGERSAKKAKIAFAFAYSAFWFSLFHLQGVKTATDFIVLGITFVNGLLFAWISRRSGSVLSSFAAHATYNGLTSLMILASLAAR